MHSSNNTFTHLHWLEACQLLIFGNNVPLRGRYGCTSLQDLKWLKQDCRGQNHLVLHFGSAKQLEARWADTARLTFFRNGKPENACSAHKPHCAGLARHGPVLHLHIRRGLVCLSATEVCEQQCNKTKPQLQPCPSYPRPGQSDLTSMLMRSMRPNCVLFETGDGD